MPWLVGNSWAFLALNSWARSLLSHLNVLAWSDFIGAVVPILPANRGRHLMNASDYFWEKFRVYRS